MKSITFQVPNYKLKWETKEDQVLIVQVILTNNQVEEIIMEIQHIPSIVLNMPTKIQQEEMLMEIQHMIDSV